VDAIVTDAPYGLGFMGKGWDHGVPGAPYWEAIGRVCKPGGYLLAFGGTRTWHRLACAIEDVGWEIRDTVLWLYGSGWPKGVGCLKPAWEPILLCRKPRPRVLSLGIDAARTPLAFAPGDAVRSPDSARHDARGRYPANVAHDGSDQVLEAFAAFEECGGGGGSTRTSSLGRMNDDGWTPTVQSISRPIDSGTAARFFYCAKASKAERGSSNNHPTVKPLALVRWLVRLVCPPGGTVLDPFLGSGTTALACLHEGRDCVGVEREPAYHAIASRRVAEEQAKRDGKVGMFAETTG
jgi:hypothetical protein